MIRDTQRSKVYKWDGTLPHKTLTLEEGKALVTRACRRYSKAIPFIANGRGTRIAYGSVTRISLPKWARTDITILHEVAHSIVQKELRYSVAFHGPEFMRVFIELLVWNKTDTLSNLLKSARIFRLKIGKIESHPKPIDFRKSLMHDIDRYIIEPYTKRYQVSPTEIRRIIKQRLK